MKNIWMLYKGLAVEDSSEGNELTREVRRQTERDLREMRQEMKREARGRRQERAWTRERETA